MFTRTTAEQFDIVIGLVDLEISTFKLLFPEEDLKFQFFCLLTWNDQDL